MKIDYRSEEVLLDDATGTVLVRTLPPIDPGNSRQARLPIGNYEVQLLPDGLFGRLRLAVRVFWMILTGRAQP